MDIGIVIVLKPCIEHLFLEVTERDGCVLMDSKTSESWAVLIGHIIDVVSNLLLDGRQILEIFSHFPGHPYPCCLRGLAPNPNHLPICISAS